MVWAGGYAPPRSVCKTDVLLLHQAHLDLGMGLVTHIVRFTRSERLSATLELLGEPTGLAAVPRLSQSRMLTITLWFPLKMDASLGNAPSENRFADG